MASRGERNNNPGNLEASPWTRSQPGYVGSDGRFAIFDTMENGINAQVSLLGGYLRKGYNTINSIINRYGNDPGTADDVSVANYKNYIANRLGVGLDSIITAAQLPSLTQAMREFETGNTTGSKGILGSAGEAIGNAVGVITNPVGSLLDVTDWFSTGIVARIAYVVIGIILIGLAIAAFVFLTDTGQKVALKVATDGLAG